MPSLHRRGPWGAVLAVVVVLAGPPAAAQTREEIERILRQNIEPVLHDIDIILTNGPAYLAKRLPAMQAGGDFGAQMDLVRIGDFSVGLGLLSGVYREFDEMDDNFQRLPKQLPDPLPIPAAVVTVRSPITESIEVGLRYGFFPEFEVKSQGYLIRGTTSIYGGKVRYRLHRGGGIVPTLVSSADVSYFTGSMDIGRDFTFTLGNTAELLGDNDRLTLNQAINQEVFDGQQVLNGPEPIDLGVFFRGAPIMGWDIYQLSLEQRAVWHVGFWQPYLGAGLDFASGHVDSGIRGLKLDTRVTGPKHLKDALAQRSVSPTILDVLPDQNVTLVSEEPRSFAARAIAGMEFNLGQAVRMVLEAQFDFHSLSGIGGLGFRYAHR